MNATALERALDIDEGRWKEHAACRDMDTRVFFPYSPKEVPPAAAAACNRCPVREECFDHALRHEDFGVWAGTSEKTRRRLRRAAGFRVDRLETGPPPARSPLHSVGEASL